MSVAVEFESLPRGVVVDELPELEVVPVPTLAGKLIPTIYRAVPETIDSSEQDFAAVITDGSTLPDPVPFTAAIVRTALEVLAGSRQVAQLGRWLDHDIYLSVAQRASLLNRLRQREQLRQRLHSGRPAKTLQPVVAIKRVHPCWVNANTVELTVVAHVDSQAKAVAVRLEGLDRRWKVTALEIG